MEDSESDNEDSSMLPVIYPEECDDNDDNPLLRQPQGPHEDPSDTPSMGPTSEPEPPNEKPNKELTSETNMITH